jgi:MarR family transcriptional regulator, organic hydroperoxide resistance regulator
MPSDNDRQEKQPEQSSPFPCLCAVIRKTGRCLTKQYDHYLKPSGLKVTQYSMLVNILRNPGITVSELAKLLLMDQTTVTRNLRVLEKSGYIRINPDAADQRVKRIQVTDTGNAKLDEARPLWEIAQVEMVRILGREEIDHLFGSLKKIST